MKKFLIFTLLYSMALSGVTVYLYANRPPAVNRTVTYLVEGKDGKTPQLGIDYFNGKDAKQLPAIQPREPDQPKEPKDPREPEAPQKAESIYEIAVRNGFIGSEEEWLHTLKPPQLFFEIRCNIVSGKFETRLNPDDLFQPVQNSICRVVL